MRPFRLLGTLFVAGALAACTAEVQEEGSLPDVDVEGGSLPQIDVEPADIDITTDTQVVEVPQIEVNGSDPN